MPIKTDNEKRIYLQTHEQVRAEGYLESSRWFRKAEELWSANKTSNNASINSVDYLNWQNKILDQDLNKRYLVLYTSSAKDANATVADRQALDLEFIADHKAYLFQTEVIEEAHYLISFLNSNSANLLIKEFQSRGLFGPRDIHKKILDVPFPRFNAQEELHQKLSELGVSCQTKVVSYVQTKELAHKDYNVGKERVAIRKLLVKNCGR